jgi:hypothetical protein
MDNARHARVVESGYGSYADVAAYLTEHFGIDPPVSRQRVYNWASRKMRNKAGVVFPRPITELDEPRTQPRKLYRFTDVAAWYRQGLPTFGSNQYGPRYAIQVDPQGSADIVAEMPLRE